MQTNIKNSKEIIMDHRWKAMDEEMGKHGYDTIVVYGKGIITQYGNLFYLGGYFPILRHGFVVYEKGKNPIAYYNTRADCYLAKEMGTIEDVRYVGTGDVIHSERELMAEIVKEVNQGNPKKVGVVGLNSNMNLQQYELITKDINAGLEDATHLMAKVKTVKTAEEIEMIRQSFSLAEESFQVFKDEIRAGRSSSEIAAEAEKVARGNGAIDTLVFVEEGPYFLRKPTSKKLTENSLVTAYVELIDANGYWVEKGGLFAIGNPPKETMDMANACVNAIKEVKQMVKPGVTVGDIADVIHKHTDHLNVNMGIWHGHGVGVDHDLPIIADHSDVALEEGMVISVHPNFSDKEEKIGASIADVFVIKENGAESLSKLSYDIVYI